MLHLSLYLHHLRTTPHKVLISAICLTMLMPVLAVSLALWLAYGFCAELVLVGFFAAPILLFWLFLLGVLRVNRRGRDLLQDYA